MSYICILKYNLCRLQEVYKTRKFPSFDSVKHVHEDLRVKHEPKLEEVSFPTVNHDLLSNIFHFKSGKKKSVSKLKQNILIELCKLFDLPTDSNCLKLRDMLNNVSIEKIKEKVKEVSNCNRNDNKRSYSQHNDSNCNNVSYNNSSTL